MHFQKFGSGHLNREEMEEFVELTQKLAHSYAFGHGHEQVKTLLKSGFEFVFKNQGTKEAEELDYIPFFQGLSKFTQKLSVDNAEKLYSPFSLPSPFILS